VTSQAAPWSIRAASPTAEAGRSTIPLVNAHDPAVGKLLLLGEDYGEYGAIASTIVGSRAAAAISVGSDPDSPSQQFKYDPNTSNEDALCVMEAGSWAGYAVADAHYGPESSHMLISRLHTIWSKIQPTDVNHLGQMIEFLRNGDLPTTESETTLLVVVYDRATREGYGISFGDSSFVIVGPGHSAEPINRRDGRYVTAAERSSLLHGSAFRFQANHGDLLLTYTDGVDECHYRQPKTSIRPAHVTAVATGAGLDPLATVDGLTRLALTGVDGNPGGQDNVAIIAAEA